MKRNRKRVPPPRGPQRRLMGIGMIVISASAFSLSLVTANLAYREGIDVHTSNAARFLLASGLLGTLVRLSGRAFPRPGYTRAVGLVLGIPIFACSYGYLGATQYIPVSLAVLIFYSSPLLVALLARFVDREAITARKVIALLMAFAGLGLALKVDPAQPVDGRGVGLAFLAAMGAACLVMISHRGMQHADAQRLNLYGLASASVLFVLFALLQGGPTLPASGSGWVKLGVTSLALAVGYVTLFAGIRAIGPVFASMLMNLEPLITIGMAVVWIGEDLTTAQVQGAGLVLGGILLLQRRERAV